MASNIYEEKPKSNKKALQSDLLYGMAKGIGGAVLKAFTNLKVEGEENVPIMGKAIITTVSKNAMRDMLIMSQISGRKIHFMINHKIMKHKVAGPVFKSLGMFRSTKNKDDTVPIDKVFEYLNEKGDLVAMTPEEKHGREVQIKSFAGIIKFAIAAKAPIIPVLVYQEKTKLFGLIPTTGLTVKVGEPIEIERKLNRDKFRDERYKVAEDIINIIDNLKESDQNE